VVVRFFFLLKWVQRLPLLLLLPARGKEAPSCCCFARLLLRRFGVEALEPLDTLVEWLQRGCRARVPFLSDRSCADLPESGERVTRVCSRKLLNIMCVSEVL